jgi:hypothetical protein
VNNYNEYYESEYNLRAHHPDFETFVERWRPHGGQASHGDDVIDGLNDALLAQIGV